MDLNDDVQRRLLKLLERGMKSSAQTLARLLRISWDMQTMSIKIAPRDQLASLIQSDDGAHYGSYCSMSGGLFLVMFSRKIGAEVSKAFAAGLPGVPARPDFEREAVAEISNILAHAMANLLADSCDSAARLSAPEIVCDTKENLLRGTASRFASTGGGKDFNLMAFIQLSSESLASDFTLVVIFDGFWKARLLDALRKG